MHDILELNPLIALISDGNVSLVNYLTSRSRTRFSLFHIGFSFSILVIRLFADFGDTLRPNYSLLSYSISFIKFIVGFK